MAVQPFVDDYLSLENFHVLEKAQLHIFELTSSNSLIQFLLPLVFSWVFSVFVYLGIYLEATMRGIGWALGYPALAHRPGRKTIIPQIMTNVMRATTGTVEYCQMCWLGGFRKPSLRKWGSKPSREGWRVSQERFGLHTTENQTVKHEDVDYFLKKGPESLSGSATSRAVSGHLCDSLFPQSFFNLRPQSWAWPPYVTSSRNKEKRKGSGSQTTLSKRTPMFVGKFPGGFFLCLLLKRKSCAHLRGAKRKSLPWLT